MRPLLVDISLPHSCRLLPPPTTRILQLATKIGMFVSHNNASTSWTPFRALTVSTTAFAGLFIVDKVLWFDSHVYDVGGGAE